MNKRRLALRLLLPVFLLVALPCTADAHTQFTGMGDFLNGVLHPLTTPAHILILLGLGLIAGQQMPPNLKRPIFVFAPVSAIALLLTTTGIITSVYQPVLICIALAAGMIVALELRLPPFAFGTLFGAAALAIGFDSTVEAAGALSAVMVFKRLLGTWLSLTLLVFNISYYVSLCARKAWMKIGIRVAGSWIIAISLLVLAFSLRKNVKPEGAPKVQPATAPGRSAPQS